MKYLNMENILKFNLFIYVLKQGNKKKFLRKKSPKK